MDRDRRQQIILLVILIIILLLLTNREKIVHVLQIYNLGWLYPVFYGSSAPAVYVDVDVTVTDEEEDEEEAEAEAEAEEDEAEAAEVPAEVEEDEPGEEEPEGGGVPEFKWDLDPTLPEKEVPEVPTFDFGLGLPKAKEDDADDDSGGGGFFGSWLDKEPKIDKGLPSKADLTVPKVSFGSNDPPVHIPPTFQPPQPVPPSGPMPPIPPQQVPKFQQQPAQQMARSAGVKQAPRTSFRGGARRPRVGGFVGGNQYAKF